MKDKLAEIIGNLIEVAINSIGTADSSLQAILNIKPEFDNTLSAIRTYLIGEIEKLPTYKEHKPGSETEYLLGKDDVIRKIKGE